MPIIKPHNVILHDGNITLRPMNDNDFDILLKWNSDSKVLYYCEGDDVESYMLEDIHDIYGKTSQTAYCFIIEYTDIPIGECWLQKLNISQLIEQFPDRDCRRIDMMIGEKTYWNKGIGTRTIRLLIDFGFNVENADIIFGVGIADYNFRSMKAFEKAGFKVFNVEEEPEGAKAKTRINMVIYNNYL